MNSNTKSGCKSQIIIIIICLTIFIPAAIAGYGWLADHPVVAGILIGAALFLLFLGGWLAGQVWQTWFTLRLMRLFSDLTGHQVGVERAVSDRERELIKVLGRGGRSPSPELPPAAPQTTWQFPMIKAPQVGEPGRDDEIMA